MVVVVRTWSVGSVLCKTTISCGRWHKVVPGIGGRKKRSLGLGKKGGAHVVFFDLKPMTAMGGKHDTGPALSFSRLEVTQRVRFVQPLSSSAVSSKLNSRC